MWQAIPVLSVLLEFTASVYPLVSSNFSYYESKFNILKMESVS
jgi:hypothetical protein